MNFIHSCRVLTLPVSYTAHLLQPHQLISLHLCLILQSGLEHLLILQHWSIRPILIKNFFLRLCLMEFSKYKNTLISIIQNIPWMFLFSFLQDENSLRHQLMKALNAGDLVWIYSNNLAIVFWPFPLVLNQIIVYT